MKIAIMGAGAVGGYFGARLAHSGQDVTFIARGAHLEAMRAHGLRVLSPLGDLHVAPVRAVARPAEAGPVELVLMCTKAYDLEAAARSMLPLLREDTAMLPLLNGVDIAVRLGAVLGTEHMLGGMCTIGAAIEAPGVIRHSGRMQGITLGEFSGELSPRVRAIADALRNAGIDTTLTDAIDVAIWSKFLFIAPMAGVSCVTGYTVKPVMADPDTRRLVRDCMQEIEAVARAQDIALPPDAVEATMRFLESRADDAKASMLLDQERGRPMELEVLNGTVARLGEALGVPTPVNRFIYAALKLRAGGTA